MEGVDVGDVVATVDINGLEKTDGHPRPQEDHVVAERHDSNEESKSQN